MCHEPTISPADLDAGAEIGGTAKKDSSVELQNKERAASVKMQAE